jgi:hypothetical protein
MWSLQESSGTSRVLPSKNLVGVCVPSAPPLRNVSPLRLRKKERLPREESLAHVGGNEKPPPVAEGVEISGLRPSPSYDRRSAREVRRTRSSGLRIVLHPNLPDPRGISGQPTGFVPDYSDGFAPASHRFPDSPTKAHEYVYALLAINAPLIQT